MLPLILSLGHKYFLAHLLYVSCSTEQYSQIFLFNRSCPLTLCCAGIARTWDPFPSSVTCIYLLWGAVRKPLHCNVKVWKVRFLCLMINLFCFFIYTIHLFVSKESAMSVKSQTFTCWNAALKQGNQCGIGLSDCAHACEQIECFPFNVTLR